MGEGSDEQARISNTIFGSGISEEHYDGLAMMVKDSKRFANAPGNWAYFSFGHKLPGRYMFTHSANFESEYLAKQIVENRDEPIDYGPMPHAIFTAPEIAGVGATEEELKQSGTSYVAASVLS